MCFLFFSLINIVFFLYMFYGFFFPPKTVNTKIVDVKFSHTQPVTNCASLICVDDVIVVFVATATTVVGRLNRFRAIFVHDKLLLDLISLLNCVVCGDCNLKYGACFSL